MPVLAVPSENEANVVDVPPVPTAPPAEAVVPSVPVAPPVPPGLRPPKPLVPDAEVAAVANTQEVVTDNGIVPVAPWQTTSVPEPADATTGPPALGVSDGAAGRGRTVTVSEVVELTQVGVTH